MQKHYGKFMWGMEKYLFNQQNQFIDLYMHVNIVITLYNLTTFQCQKMLFGGSTIKLVSKLPQKGYHTSADAYQIPAHLRHPLTDFSTDLANLGHARDKTVNKFQSRATSPNFTSTENIQASRREHHVWNNKEDLGSIRQVKAVYLIKLSRNRAWKDFACFRILGPRFSNFHDLKNKLGITCYKNVTRFHRVNFTSKILINIAVSDILL